MKTYYLFIFIFILVFFSYLFYYKFSLLLLLLYILVFFYYLFSNLLLISWFSLLLVQGRFLRFPSSVNPIFGSVVFSFPSTSLSSLNPFHLLTSPPEEALRDDERRWKEWKG